MSPAPGSASRTSSEIPLPQPAEDRSGVRDATEPGAPCVQPDMANGERLEDSSEDCLYLNVTVPRSVDGPVPVMVWSATG